MSWIDRWRGIHWAPPWDAGWLFVLLSLAMVAYAILVYRRNEAPLRPLFKSLLIGLRALSLVLLVIILCRPVLSLAVPGGAARGVLVLLDRSASLTLPGRTAGEDRNQELARAALAIEVELGTFAVH
jgi:hypothetical protein